MYSTYLHALDLQRRKRELVGMAYMGFVGHHYLCSAILVTLFASFTIPEVENSFPFPIAKPNCSDQCGGVRIPFPFGQTPGCALSNHFLITCNTSFHPPKPFLGASNTEITTHISLDGQMKVFNPMAHYCFRRDGTMSSSFYNESSTWINVFPFTLNTTANKLTVVGCDTYGYVRWGAGHMVHPTCCAMCATTDELQQGSCKGPGCCEIPIPEGVSTPVITLGTHEHHTKVWDFNDCGYAFVAEEDSFSFYLQNLTNLAGPGPGGGFPMVVDWTIIGNGTCRDATACQSLNSVCYHPTSSDGYGYRCSCQHGYQGNPYLIHGCKDIDECEDERLNKCEKHCVNTRGGFECICPQGYGGDGRRDGRGCVPHESHIFRLVAGASLGVIVLLVPSCWLRRRVKLRRAEKMRQKYFIQNGGVLLQQKLNITGVNSSVSAKIFTEAELRKATNNFHNSNIIGRGGFGTVYKGILPDHEVVAIKKSIEVFPRQIDQFVNEVIVLSQINHRNVVKLLGCCLETQAPLLVYEFIDSGTLSQHIHHTPSLSWPVRLRIAVETAGVLSYLHSAASTPIIHRDVKSSNILLDHNFTAKVSDFGASRLFPLDQTQLTTIVQGTFGYLDPEYMQTSQLTEKSDVYSFGVVLVELLTGRKAVCNDGPDEERCLAHFFLAEMKQDRLFQVVETSFLGEENREQLMKVALVAQSCLKVKGYERPFMKEVAMELDGLLVGDKHSSVLHIQHSNPGEDEVLLRNNMMEFINGEGCSIGSHNKISHSFLSVGR